MNDDSNLCLCDRCCSSLNKEDLIKSTCLLEKKEKANQMMVSNVQE